MTSVLAEDITSRFKSSLVLEEGHVQGLQSMKDEQRETAAASGRISAGQDQALEALRELIGWRRLYSKEGRDLGIQWPRGLLLHGPSGCGKTLLVQQVAREFDATLRVVTASDILGAYAGESERRLRESFESARAEAEEGGKIVVMFLDEVDALCPRRDGQRQHESRLVAQLLTLLDGAAVKPKEKRMQGQGQGQGRVEPAEEGYMIVVGATNRPNALDPALRRPGRLDREVLVTLPNEAGRKAILLAHTASLKIDPSISSSVLFSRLYNGGRKGAGQEGDELGAFDLLGALATACHGYSGADLAALVREAAMSAILSESERRSKQLAAPDMVAPKGGNNVRVVVTAMDFEAAMKRVGPSIARGAELEVPPVHWDDIGGLPEVKRRLRQAVEWPLMHGEAFKRLGLKPPRGVLLYGPPGTAKTTLARAAASASRATLLPLSCAQLFSMYAGEGESILRETFQRARLSAPSIILLDEVDAVAARRPEGGGEEGGGDSSSLRLLSTLLTEMDGMEQASSGVLVLAATNRPEAIDPALTRPGRLDVHLYVPPPDEQGRHEVLKVHTRKMPLDESVDLAEVARSIRAVGLTGAEIEGLCREAAMVALREDVEGAHKVSGRHFREALESVKPATSPQDLERYRAWGRG